MSDRIIFLDVDGVLNSDQVCFEIRMNDINQNGYGGFFGGTVTPTHALVCWGQELVDNLREIVEKTNAQIVISSTWRITHPVKQFIEMFKIYGWDNAPVIDKTEHLGTQRGYEISKWLERHSEVKQYVILDDNSDMLKEQKDNFVQTDEKVGLSKQDVLKAIAILEKNNE